MKYNAYQYLWPPRPDAAIAREMIPHYERQGFWAQVKKNGTCTVIFTDGDQVIFKTRHNDDHKQWSPLPEHIDFFKSQKRAWNVYVAELLHSKTPHVKNQLYIFDQIVKDDVQLVRTTFGDRQRMLLQRWEQVKLEKDMSRVSPYVSVARSFNTGFMQLWADLQPEDEGLVLKDPNAQLKLCLKPAANSGWQVKSRRPTKNYGF